MWFGREPQEKMAVSQLTSRGVVHEEDRIRISVDLMPDGFLNKQLGRAGSGAWASYQNRTRRKGTFRLVAAICFSGHDRQHSSSGVGWGRQKSHRQSVEVRSHIGRHAASAGDSPPEEPEVTISRGCRREWVADHDRPHCGLGERQFPRERTSRFLVLRNTSVIRGN